MPSCATILQAVQNTRSLHTAMCRRIFFHLFLFPLKGTCVSLSLLAVLTHDLTMQCVFPRVIQSAMLCHSNIARMRRAASMHRWECGISFYAAYSIMTSASVNEEGQAAILAAIWPEGGTGT